MLSTPESEPQPHHRIRPSARRLVTAGGLLGALAVAASAFGAHALQDKLAPTQLAWFDTGARYQLVHAAALVAVGVLGTLGWRVGVAGALLLAGVIVFSGTLYAMALGGPRWLGAVTPIGGVMLVAGWLALALPACAARSRAD